MPINDDDETSDIDGDDGAGDRYLRNRRQRAVRNLPAMSWGEWLKAGMPLFDNDEPPAR